VVHAGLHSAWQQQQQHATHQHLAEGMPQQS
jgi:hypothetical protein